MNAAQRRKGRRLRAWWRHEQQSIAVTLATSTHHSKQQNCAPRSQRTSTRDRRSVHRERGQASSRGRRGVTAACGTPQGMLSRPSACPHRLEQWLFSLSCLTAQALEAKRKEEERKKKREELLHDDEYVMLLSEALGCLRCSCAPQPPPTPPHHHHCHHCHNRHFHYLRSNFGSRLFP